MPGIAVTELPALNALLNIISAFFLLLGFYFVKRGRKSAHRAAMLAALGTSTLFLVSYLVYHYEVGHVPYRGVGWIRGVYFAILATHVVLAALILPMIATTIGLAIKGSPRHPRLGRWTFAAWLYVSVTGVLVFLMVGAKLAT